MSQTKAVLLAILILAVTACWTPAFGQEKKQQTPRSPITASNYRWTTYTNGWAELSYSLKNNTRFKVKNVKHRVVLYGRSGEPIHYEEPYDTTFEIAPGLAVTRTIHIMEGGLNIYHSTASIRVEILAYDSPDEKQ